MRKSVLKCGGKCVEVWGNVLRYRGTGGSEERRGEVCWVCGGGEQRCGEMC